MLRIKYTKIFVTKRSDLANKKKCLSQVCSGVGNNHRINVQMLSNILNLSDLVPFKSYIIQH